jgi:hypothetical protein
MLNLSDKELDRISREAADQHEPGDQLGPRSWERLKVRLDKEMGRIGPSPLRSIRRLPFYYAPVILLLIGAGITRYFIRQRSGSPPMTVVKPITPEQKQNNSTDLSTKTSENSSNSTSAPTDSLKSTLIPGSADAPGSTSPNGGSSIAQGSTIPGPSPTILPGSASPKGASSIAKGSTAPGAGSANDQPPTAPGESSPGSRPSATSGRSAILPGSTASRSTPGRSSILPGIAGPKEGSAARSPRRNRGGKDHAGPKDTDLSANQSSAGRNSAYATTQDQAHVHYPDQDPTHNHNNESPSHNNAGNSPSNAANSPSQDIATVREPSLSLIQAPRSLARSRGIDDAALRAFTLKGASASTPIRIDKKKNASQYISRPLQWGFTLSPDFASVNSLAGDRPGSSIGLTLDYEFLDRLYLSTGLLLTRKNFAASPENYHVPDSYYRLNGIFNINPHEVNLIKGSFYMLEIPLNLRYDFRLSGSTTFFISGGASSYLMTSEHSQYYFNYFGNQVCLNFNKAQESGKKNYLFSTVNLSMGVETGLSNSLSLLIAPYAKIPTRGIGLGQVQLTSVGISFALKYAPVLSRKKH